MYLRKNNQITQNSYNVQILCIYMQKSVLECAGQISIVKSEGGAEALRALSPFSNL